MSELKPCPFCGGSAVFSNILNHCNSHSVGFSFKIECEDCGITTPNTYSAYFSLGEDGNINPLQDGIKQAINEWNRRADNGTI